MENESKNERPDITKVRRIYIKLMDEGVDVWKPVNALELEKMKFKILEDDEYNSQDEIWEFPPGTIVRCEMKKLTEGVTCVAVEKIDL